MATVLVVDDESHIRDVVCFALEKAGYVTVQAEDGEHALVQFTQKQPDLVILDVVMPGREGTDVCREIRKTSDVPVVFLTSRSEEIDRIIGFELGGDDYVTKPFSPRELVARVKAVLRRRAPAETNAQDEILKWGPLTLDIQRHVATCDVHTLTLTATEFSMLRTLMTHPGNVYSRASLMDHAYELARVVSDRTIDSNIRRLRQKLKACDADVIHTVHGVGFRLALDKT